MTLLPTQDNHRSVVSEAPTINGASKQSARLLPVEDPKANLYALGRCPQPDESCTHTHTPFSLMS
jgi:hypothetical protein